MPEPIVIGWEEWKASRSAKRENLKRLGLQAPSRRETDYGKTGSRLRKAFGGRRVPLCLDIRADEGIGSS